MKDFYPKGTGNSRYLKSSIPATTTHDDLISMLRSGTFPIDLNGINNAGVAQQGTPLNKATLLQDATAALFGLSTDAVPDDVLAYVGKYAQHWWRRFPFYYQENQTALTGTLRLVHYTNDPDRSRTIYYAESITIDQLTGSVSLKNQKSTVVTYRGWESVMSVIGEKYITNAYESPSDVYYVPSNAEVSRASMVGVTIEGVYTVSSISSVNYDNPEYVQSSNRHTYPDSGEQDGYEYQYLGIPFDNAASPHVKIATGSYVGTGKYGSSNPNSLTFDFEPKIVMISSAEHNDYFAIFPCFSLPASYPSNIGYGWSGLWNGTLTSLQDNYAKLLDNTLSWYYAGSSSAAIHQLNYSNTTYTYLVIG